MHAAALLAVLATVFGVSAFQVTVPNANQGWASTGSNTLSWQRVSTDATNFTVYLTNTDRSVLPQNDLLLSSFVDASSTNTVSIEMPSSGFNPGGSYRINLVASQDEPNTIYAQSSEFNITAGTSSATGSTASSRSSSTSASSGASTTSSATRTSLSSGTGTTATATTASTSTDLNPSTTANAAKSRKAEFGLLGALLLLGGFLA